MSDHDATDATPNIKQLAEEIEGATKKKMATIIIDLAKDSGVELFHTPDFDTYVTAVVNGKRETWPVRSGDFEAYLIEKYLTAEGEAPGTQALHDAINTMSAQARFRGPCKIVSVRMAQIGDIIYLDIGDEARTVIRVTATGWEPVQDAPTPFRRPKGSQPLPLPLHGGNLDELRGFLNVPKLEQWRLLLVWLVAVFFTKGPFTFLVLKGRQGAAKSTTARVLRRLCDPNQADLRAQPQSEENLIVSARNCKLMVFDNISYIADWLSDALCRLATGGGFATRKFFTNLDEIIVDVCRPVLLTGIDDSADRPDLLDRCLLMELPPIAPGMRRTEAEFWSEFEASSGRILGAVLDLLSGVLRHLPEAQARLSERPRMADYAERGIAVELALGWGEDQFIAAYEENLAAANDIAIEASLIGTYICDLAVQGWEGTRTELVKKLEQLFDQQTTGPRPHHSIPLPPQVKRQRPKGWPSTAKALKSQLLRLIPSLTAKGVEVVFWQTSGTGSKKMVTINMTAQPIDAAATVQVAFVPPVSVPPASPLHNGQAPAPVPAAVPVPPVQGQVPFIPKTPMPAPAQSLRAVEQMPAANGQMPAPFQWSPTALAPEHSNGAGHGQMPAPVNPQPRDS